MLLMSKTCSGLSLKERTGCSEEKPPHVCVGGEWDQAHCITILSGYMYGVASIRALEGGAGGM